MKASLKHNTKRPDPAGTLLEVVYPAGLYALEFITQQIAWLDTENMCVLLEPAVIRSYRGRDVQICVLTRHGVGFVCVNFVRKRKVKSWT